MQLTLYINVGNTVKTDLQIENKLEKYERNKKNRIYNLLNNYDFLLNNKKYWKCNTRWKFI